MHQHCHHIFPCMITQSWPDLILLKSHALSAHYVVPPFPIVLSTMLWWRRKWRWHGHNSLWFLVARSSLKIMTTTASTLDLFLFPAVWDEHSNSADHCITSAFHNPNLVPPSAMSICASSYRQYMLHQGGSLHGEVLRAIVMRKQFLWFDWKKSKVTETKSGAMPFFLQLINLKL